MARQSKIPKVISVIPDDITQCELIYKHFTRQLSRVLVNHGNERKYPGSDKGHLAGNIIIPRRNNLDDE